jgi:hypothetical protein
MHLDDSYVKMATALLQFGSAYLALRQVRLVKKSESRCRTSLELPFFKKSSHVLILGAGFSHQKKLI